MSKARRSAVAVPNVKKTVGDYLQEFLQQLGNQFCADCLEKDPQWIAFPHGVIICDNCAGAHRSLGSHVSQVKSVHYDRWDMKMYHNLEKCGGNTVINSTLAKYCEQFEQPTPQTSADEREKFIKNKYELKIYSKPKKTNDKAESLKRIAHYFLIVQKDEMILPDLSDKNQNQKSTLRFVTPSDIFKAEYSSGISFRYPAQDYDSVPLPGRVFDFIFPEGVRISDSMRLPERRAFVLTDAEGNKMNCACIVFWERISPMDILSMSETLNKFRKECGEGEITTMPSQVYAPKAICLLSHWPFFNQFTTYLETLYRITKTPNAPIPVERYLMNFMHEVPVPPMGKTSVQFVAGDEQKTVLISSHLHLLLEVAETISALLFPFQVQGVYMPMLPSKLLDFLHSPVPYLAGVDPAWIKGQHYDDVVFVYLDNNTIFTTSTQSLEALPKRPKQKLESRIEELLPWLNQQSPTKSSKSKPKQKLSMGIGGGNMNEEKYNPSTDSERITQEINHHLDLLPISNFLTSGSTIQSNDQFDSKKQKKAALHNDTETIFREIQRAFLKFFTSILEQYANKWTEKQKKSDPHFNGTDYVYFRLNPKSRLVEFEKEKFLDEGIDKTFRPFMQMLCGTQLFMAFCQEREELIESKSKDIPDEIRFFDESIIAKKNRSTLRTKKVKTAFLNDKSMELKSVFVANPPNINDLDETEFNYSAFPSTLRESRFGVVRKVNAPWDTNKHYGKMRRQKSMKFNKKTHSALQQLLAMQHAAHINQAKSWDNFTEHVLVVQQYVRMVIARKRFKHQKLAVLALQREAHIHHEARRSFEEFKALRTAAIHLQSTFKTYLMVQRHRNEEYFKSTTTLQAVFRGYLYQKQFQELFASTITLQSVFKTYGKRKSADTKLEAVRFCQSYIRTAYLRNKHMSTMQSISRCQAVLRGTLLRNQQRNVLRIQLQKIRKEIQVLWQKTHTAFMYRAKFWIVYEGATYLNLAIHNEELDRLRLLHQRHTTNAQATKEAIQRFETEKRELRRLLKDELDQNIRESLYTEWSINFKSKHKKDKLLGELFKTPDDDNPRKSATTLLTICSSHSASILDVTSQVELRRADRIRDNLLLTVFSSLSSMQSLNRSLQKQQKHNRKQQLTIRSMTDELSHKQSVIIKQRSKLAEFGSAGNHHLSSFGVSPNFKMYSHPESREGSPEFSASGGVRRYSDAGLLPKAKKSLISVKPMTVRSGSADFEDPEEMINSRIRSPSHSRKASKNKNKTQSQSHHTAQFHSARRKKKAQQNQNHHNHNRNGNYLVSTATSSSSSSTSTTTNATTTTTTQIVLNGGGTHDDDVEEEASNNNGHGHDQEEEEVQQKGAALPGFSIATSNSISQLQIANGGDDQIVHEFQ